MPLTSTKARSQKSAGATAAHGWRVVPFRAAGYARADGSRDNVNTTGKVNSPLVASDVGGW